MRLVILAAVLAAVSAPAYAQDPNDPNGDRRTHELNAEVKARLDAQTAEEARAKAEYDRQMAQYERDVAAHRASVARAEACDAGDRSACDPG